mmetsp:Transcript_30061/g.82554  ORF Transcript_30061/g.82554 Transcript_30061/m.82554 type:complete len:372 (-) Transcript_30061:1627-2742(-)|eukprot:CAMPEP_0168717460 /NCGR_PEP_ID=MMETSP0724-20121128/11_1 /TAXON_ID=265536 /ORGANISM="Amphiprora sp., Strain CCMP467" /LENGTH=371 /DNA_ID=CAMNT_0008763937 /DNA_START=140 /DNA_END=1255 /DNA_ORIENTATION=-
MNIPLKQLFIPAVLLVFLFTALRTISSIVSAAHLDLSIHKRQKRIAIVMRTMMPLKQTTLRRMVLTARAMERSKFQNYDFHVMSDETKMNGTEAAVKRYFDKLADVPVPRIFPINESMVLEYFAPGLQRYASGPLVNGESGECCGVPLLWQLSVPPFVMFLSTHKYDYAWNFEEDVWAVGKGVAPLADLMYEWDRQMETAHNIPVGFAGVFTKANGCPFNVWLKDRHTQSFQDLLVNMQNSSVYDAWKKPKGILWHDFAQNTAPEWSCISDAVYRHSLNFSNYFKAMICNGTYRFGEALQQPMAWSGNFLAKELKTLLPREKTPTGFERLTLNNGQKKLLESEAMDFYLASWNNRTAGHLMHSREAQLEEK